MCVVVGPWVLVSPSPKAHAYDTAPVVFVASTAKFDPVNSCTNTARGGGGPAIACTLIRCSPGGTPVNVCVLPVTGSISSSSSTTRYEAAPYTGYHAMEISPSVWPKVGVLTLVTHGLGVGSGTDCEMGPSHPEAREPA